MVAVHRSQVECEGPRSGGGGAGARGGGSEGQNTRTHDLRYRSHHLHCECLCVCVAETRLRGGLWRAPCSGADTDAVEGGDGHHDGAVPTRLRTRRPSLRERGQEPLPDPGRPKGQAAR